MTERPRFFDDLAGVAGGAFSALSGMRDEAESLVRARVDEALRRLDLVKREDLDAVQEMASAARAGQERAEARLAAIEARLAGMEAAATPIPMPAPAHTPAAAHGSGPVRGPGPVPGPVPGHGSGSGAEAPPVAMPAGGEAGAAIGLPPTQ